MTVSLSFHGAAGCVTGFCARLVTDRATLLIDCGMFQGPKTLKALNYGDFPFDPTTVDAVLLTHAHIDHSGLLPKLTRAGFRGPIYATAGTRELCEVMLPDAAHIQESEVRQLNRRNQRRGRPEVRPIFTAHDVTTTMTQFRKVKLNQDVVVAPGVTATYWEAGHILGGASIQLRIETAEGPQTYFFSGDIGPGGRDYIADPQGPSGIDYLIMESTYGDRERVDLASDARRAVFAEELNGAYAAGGPLLIPAFAVERSQELLADLMLLMDEGRVPVAKIFLDSPLAIEATEVFQKRGWNRDTGVNPFERLQSAGRLEFLRHPDESDRLERLSGWHIIIAASGMCDAGRVRGHLKRLLSHRQATVLLSGFQAAGTLGRVLKDGARRVTIQGEDFPVRARVRALDVYSAHADAKGLVAWAIARNPIAAGVFLAHGEPAALAALREGLVTAGISAERIVTPAMDDSFSLSATDMRTVEGIGRRISPGAAARADWHNARAHLLTTLNDALEAAPDDHAREVILARLTAVFEAASRSDAIVDQDA